MFQLYQHTILTLSSAMNLLDRTISKVVTPNNLFGS